MKRYTSASVGNSTRIKRWAVLIVYSCIILFTLSIVRSIRDATVEYLGPGGFNWIIWILFFVAALCLGIWLVRKKVYRSLSRTVILICSAGAYIIIINRLELAVERLHYLEYGAIAILALRAFMTSHRNSGAIILSLMYVFDLGLVDEFVQWILPMRVGEFRDVGINLTAGIFALIPALSCNIGFGLLRLPSRKSISGILFLGTASLILWGIFMTFVHGFGHEYTLDNGTRFKSVFNKREFDGISRIPAATAWRDVSRSPLATRADKGFITWFGESLKQWRAFRHTTPEAYNYEAWRHVRHRDGLANQRYRKFREAFEEEKILRGFYREYLDSFESALDDSVYRRYGKMAPRDPVPYVSPIQELLITSISERPFRVIILITGVIMGFFGIFLHRSRYS